MAHLSRRTYAIVAVVLAAAIFVALNIGADATLTTSRLDLTANGQFTLAQGTKNIVGNLKEPIVLKFFYSKKAASEYATVTAYAAQVRDLLNEYAALSHGKIIVEELDPQPFSEAEDQAQANGLTAAPTQSGELWRAKPGGGLWPNTSSSCRTSARELPRPRSSPGMSMSATRSGRISRSSM